MNTRVDARVRCDGEMVCVDAAAMEELLYETFVRVGCHRDEARNVGHRLTGANLRGHDSHGAIRSPRYVQWVEDGWMTPNQDIRIEKETDTFAIVDAGYGFGQTAGQQTVAVGIEKARRQGVAVTALKHAGHLGRIGDWAEQAADAGIASIHMVNARGALLVAPFGAADRRASTSPFCAGVPMPDRPPIVLDFATSTVAEGKALVALRGGPKLPEGAIVDADGKLTSDPRPLYGELEPGRDPDPRKGPGALTSFGLHKGSGLNFFMEMFGGALTGSGTVAALDDPRPRPFCNGMLSVYLDVAAFHADDWFAREVRAYVEFFKAARPAEPGGEVLIPGEKELRTMEKRLAEGLPLSPETWRQIVGAAVKTGTGTDRLREILGHGWEIPVAGRHG